jgi:hypothetical protein
MVCIGIDPYPYPHIIPLFPPRIHQVPGGGSLAAASLTLPPNGDLFPTKNGGFTGQKTLVSTCFLPSKKLRFAKSLRKKKIKQGKALRNCITKRLIQWKKMTLSAHGTLV